MADKSTLTLEKSTVELVGKVKRKLAFDGDRDFTNDEVIVKLCEDYLAKGDDSDEPDVVAVPMEEPAE